MFSHVRVGSTDIARSRAFYDAALGALGLEGKELYGMLMYTKDNMHFVVATPIDGAATYANGGTIGFVAPSPEAIERFHAAGLANGGKCEGAPGPRAAAGGMHAAYLRDPDGNKIGAFARPA